MPASVGDDDARPDVERVTWSVLAEVEHHLDAAGVDCDREEVVVGGAGSVLQQQQPGDAVAAHPHLHPVPQLTSLSERQRDRQTSTPPYKLLTNIR